MAKSRNYVLIIGLFKSYVGVMALQYCRKRRLLSKTAAGSDGLEADEDDEGERSATQPYEDDAGFVS